jgi:hypothetical protein
MKEFDDIPTIEPGLYQHYKGGKYEVLGIGCNTEAHEYYVVYSPSEPKAGIPKMWVRPYAMFVETVEVDGKTIPRFKKLSD